jgi:hypothetical protein
MEPNDQSDMKGNGVEEENSVVIHNGKTYNRVQIEGIEGINGKEGENDEFLMDDE